MYISFRIQRVIGCSHVQRSNQSEKENLGYLVFLPNMEPKANWFKGFSITEESKKSNFPTVISGLLLQC